MQELVTPKPSTEYMWKLWCWQLTVYPPQPRSAKSVSAWDMFFIEPIKQRSLARRALLQRSLARRSGQSSRGSNPLHTEEGSSSVPRVVPHASYNAVPGQCAVHPQDGTLICDPLVD